jgi:acetyl-CoA synthetase
MFGMNPVLLDDKANELMGNDQSGALCLKTPWPGMARTVVGDHERFKQAYFTTYPGYYFTGDGAYRDKDGYYQITGRMDDVINVTGHRLGTAEVEDVLTDHPMVAEAAVVGFPHEVKGEGVYAYVILKLVDGEKLTEAQNSEIINELRQSVKKNISGFAVPEKLQICSGLPKTRSGKIMRRILRKVAANLPDELGDVSTLAEPSIVVIVDEIVANHIKLNL